MRSRSGSRSPKIRESLSIVVDSPPGMMSPSRPSSSAGRGSRRRWHRRFPRHADAPGNRPAAPGRRSGAPFPRGIQGKKRGWSSPQHNALRPHGTHGRCRQRPGRPGSMPLLGYITEHALLQRSARQVRPPGLPAQGRRLGPSRACGRKNRPRFHAADAVHAAAGGRRRQWHEREDHHHQDGRGTAREPGTESLHQPHRQQLHPRRGRGPPGRGGLAGPARCRHRGPGTG